MALRRARRWASLDTEFLRRPRIVELRETHGPVGPLLIIALILAAEQTNESRATNSAIFDPRRFAETVDTDEEHVRAIIHHAQRMGLVRHAHEVDPVTKAGRERVYLLKRPKWAAPEPRKWSGPKRVPTDARIEKALREHGPMTSEDLAGAVDLTYGGSFRKRVRDLRVAGRIVRENCGVYRLPEPA